MAEPFYKTYLAVTHRPILDTPEKVLQELYNVVADYQRIQSEIATICSEESPEYQARFLELDFLVSRWWISLDILGLHLPLRFVKELLVQLLNDKRIQNLLEWQQVLLVAVLLLKFLEEHPEELLDPRGEPWFDHQQELLIILMDALVEKQQISEVLFRFIRFETSYTPEQRKEVISTVLWMISKMPVPSIDESPKQ